MQLWEMVLLGVGLSMDAFAVSICHGLGMRKINFWHAAVVALFFGGSQALMPLLGWLLGSQFQQYIERFDHWIAFVLLAIIGSKMIWETLHGGDADEKPEDSKLDLGRLSFMAIATSIDALAVGVSLALSSNRPARRRTRSSSPVVSRARRKCWRPGRRRSPRSPPTSASPRRSTSPPSSSSPRASRRANGGECA